MMTHNLTTNQQRIVDFFKKLVEARSDGRLAIKIMPASPLSPDQLIQSLSQEELTLALIETNQLRNHALQLNNTDMTTRATVHKRLYPLMDVTLTGRPHSSTKKLSLKLLAHWDDSPSQSTANRQQTALSGTSPLYSTYALLVAQKQWNLLAPDKQVIIHEALYTVTLYADEFAGQYIERNISAPPPKNTDNSSNFPRLRTLGESYKPCLQQLKTARSWQDQTH